MPARYSIPPWKCAPFLRLLLPFVCGIVIQYYFHFQLFAVILTGAFAVLLIACTEFLSPGLRYRFRNIRGLFLTIVICCFASLLTRQKNIQNNAQWFGKYYNDSAMLYLRVTEPPTEKEHTYKAEGAVEALCGNGFTRRTTGAVLLYFRKDDSVAAPKYGDRLLVRTVLQPIENSGNPGCFDEAKYFACRGILHRAFLKKGDYSPVRENTDKSFFKNALFCTGKFASLTSEICAGQQKSLRR